MVASKGLDFSDPGSIAAGFGEVLHSCRAIRRQSAAVWTWVKRVLILPLLYTFNIHFLTWFDVINAQFSKRPIVCSLKIFDDQTVVFDRVL